MTYLEHFQEVTQNSAMFEILAGLLVSGIILLIGAMISLLWSIRQLATTTNRVSKDVETTKNVTIKTWDAHDSKDSKGRWTWHNPDEEVLKELRNLSKIATLTLHEIKNGGG